MYGTYRRIEMLFLFLTLVKKKKVPKKDKIVKNKKTKINIGPMYRMKEVKI